MRALTIWRNCEGETCGNCDDVRRVVCDDLQVRPACRQFGPILEGAPVRRCQACLDAESKALAVAGVARAELPTMPGTRIAPPKRDSSGGHTVFSGRRYGKTLDSLMARIVELEAERDALLASEGGSDGK